MQQELHNNIECIFSIHYSHKQCSQLSIQLMQYFIDHQFDEWQDIVDDIGNGFDNCCCKNVLFTQLNVTNIEHKMDEYNRLKQCIPSKKSFKQIYDGVIDVFTYYFNIKVATQILDAFKCICQNEQYRNVQIVTHDICNIKSSKIISYIYNQIYKNTNNDDNFNFKFILTQFLRCIINGKTLDFIQKQSPMIKPIAYHSKDESFLKQMKEQMVKIFSCIFNTRTKDKIVKCCFDYIEKQQFDNIDSIKDDLDDVEQSEILNAIFENIGGANQINTQTNANNMNDLLHEYDYKHIITQHILNIIADILEERKRFNIKNFVFTKGTSHNDTYDDSLMISKQIELINGFPILMWLLDAFSRDRINKFKKNPLMNYQYNISKWLKNNVFCNFINQQNPWMAVRIRSAVKVLVKRNLPSIQFNPYCFLCDSLDIFAKYTLCFHEFSCEILKRYQCAPIQFDFMIIPETTVSRKQDQNMFNNIEHDATWIYFKDKDYFKQRVQKDLLTQLLVMYGNNNLQLTTKRRKRYIFIIDRRKKTYMDGPDTIYFIIPKQCDELPNDWNMKREIALGLSQNYIIPPSILNYKKRCNICLSYQLFTVNNCKSYVFINGTGHKFELDDMVCIWPIYFSKINDKKQTLSNEMLTNIHEYNINKTLRNDDFDEFLNQCKNLRLKGYPDPNIKSDYEDDEMKEDEDEDGEQMKINMIKQQIYTVFTQEFNERFADKIFKSFIEVVEKEKFNDIDAISEDLEDVSNSIILCHIMEDIEGSLFGRDNRNQRQNIIHILKNIVKQEGEDIDVISYSSQPLMAPILNSITRNLLSMRRVINSTKEHKLSMIKLIRKTFSKIVENQLIEDLQNNNSQILNGIFDVIGDQLIDVDFTKKLLIKDIKAMFVDKRFFILTKLDFHVTEIEIEQARNLVDEHCSNIFFHADTGEFAPDKNLCIAKAIDIKNGIPLTLWLLDMYTRYRIDTHEEFLKHEEKTKDVSVNYDVVEWFDNDNIFCKYIAYKHGEYIADVFKSALNALISRILPTLNLVLSLTPIIYDSLNEFIKYALALQHFILSFVNETNEETEYIFPLQFDCWIIPQAVKKEPMRQPFSFGHDDDDDDDDNDSQIHVMTKDNQKSANDSNTFWDLEYYLTRSGYIENYDYIVEYAEQSFGKLKKQFRRMWVKLFGRRYRNRRYILIIDRRHEINIKSKDMSRIKPTWDFTKYASKDKIYLIIAKEKYMTYNQSKINYMNIENNHQAKADMITNKFYLLNEYPLGESRKYIFPYSENEGDQGPITMLDSMCGYKFGLSYHLFQTKHCKAYWYLNSGATKFKLSDMLWFWSKCFAKINDNGNKYEQQIDNRNMEIYKNTKQLPDVKFDEFMRQAMDSNNLQFQKAENGLKQQQKI